MKQKLLILWLMLLAGVSGLRAAEAYYSVEYDEDISDVTVRFYYDNKRAQRPNTFTVTENGTPLFNHQTFVYNGDQELTIIFDSSFASYRPLNTSYWFSYSEASTIDFGGWENLNTSEVTNMSHMFSGMSTKQFNLENFDLSHFDTRKVTNMSYMLSGIKSECEKSFDISSLTFNSNAITTGLMKSTPTYEVRIPMTANNLASDAFEGIGSVQYPVDLLCPPGFTPQNVTQYNGYVKWKSGYFSDNGAYFTEGAYFTVEYLDEEYDEYDNLSYMACRYVFYYDDQRATRGRTRNVTQNGTPLDFSTEYDIVSIKSVVFDSSFANFRPTNTSHWFDGLSQYPVLAFEGFQNLNTSEVTDMSYMFHGLDGDIDIEDGLDLSHFDTRKVTDMSYMFADIHNSLQLDLSNFTINLGCNTANMMSNSAIWMLTVPSNSTGNNLDANACTGVGTIDYPCTLVCPPGVTPQGATQYNGYIKWKSGYFKKVTLEPYAVLSTDNKTLTFYYDTERATRTGTSYDMNTENYRPGWYVYGDNPITSVVFDSSFADARPITCNDWFYGCTNLTSITGMEYLNTSQVTSMESMFTNCQMLENIDVSHFNTSNVESMAGMFSRCFKLAAIDVSHFDTSKVPVMMGMFNECNSLESLDVSNFIIPAPDSYSGWGSLRMFADCSGLKTLVVPATAGNLADDACEGVGTQFAPCTLVYPDGFTPQKTATGDGWYKWKGGYFKDVSPEPYAVLSTDNTKLTFYYDKNRYSRPGTSYDMNTEINTPGWYVYDNNPITNVVFDSSFADARPTSCYCWFYRMTNLTSITGLEYLNTENVTNMASMFAVCPQLSDIDVSHFNTTQVQDMGAMFEQCSFTSIDVSNFDTSNVTNMLGMFYNNKSLETLDISNFVIPDSTSYYDLGSSIVFVGCSGLKTLVLPATAHNFKIDACRGVGTQSAPCTLVYPDGFTPQKTATGDGWYKWKGGYFKDAGPEPYAVLSTDNTKLTFYYDKNRYSRPGTSYDLNTGINSPGWCDNNAIVNVTSVEFDSSFADARPTSCFRWFEGMANLTSISLMRYLNTSEVTRMDAMFDGCSSLQTLDLGYFNTSNVTSMGEMFYHCSALTSLNISSFDTSNVTEMAGMFLGCSSLASLDVSNFDTSNVTAMFKMFSGCSSLTNIDVSHFNVQKVQFMAYMFEDCSSLENMDLSSFENLPENYYDGENGMLYGTYEMLKGCSALKRLSVSASANDLSDAACTGVGTVSAPCTLVYPDGFTPQKTAEGDGWYKWKNGYFKDAERVAYAVLSTDNTTLTFYYDPYSDSREGTVYGMNTGSNTPEWYSNHTSVTNVVFDSSFAGARPGSCYSWFSKMFNLVDIEGIQYLNTSAVTNMKYMFRSCSGLTSLDVRGFNTGNVTDMNSMFSSCSVLTSLDVTRFDTRNVTDMQSMFSGCTSLTSLDVSGFVTTNVTNMRAMFNDCKGLASLDLSGFITANVTDMSYMFRFCGNLTSLDLSKFNTAKVTNMTYMFNECKKLTTLDVSGFDTNLVTNMENMFCDCTDLTSLDVSSFNIPSNKTMGFVSRCSSLQTLVIPIMAGRLDYLACSGVGTQAAPCTLVYPAGFTPETTATGDGWYQWKGGYFCDEESLLMGDVNHDGAVTITDVTLTVDYVLGKHPSPFYIENADVSPDDVITISDVTAIVNILLHKDASHAPATAREATMDRLWLTANGGHCLLHLDTPERYTAMHITLRLPEGASMGNVSIASARSAGHQVETRALADGLYNVVLYANNNSELRSDDTALLHFDIAGCQPRDVEVVAIQSTNRLFETIMSSGTTTGIDIVETDDATDGDSYNTVGVRVGKNARGVVIKNGIKTVKH